eukprot:1141756-Pelagomonas_calceolata.AAC.1
MSVCAMYFIAALLQTAGVYAAGRSIHLSFHGPQQPAIQGCTVSSCTCHIGHCEVLAILTCLHADHALCAVPTSQPQACCQSSWSSSLALPNQPFPPEHSIILHEPFIEASPPNWGRESSCTFNLTLIAPPSFALRGWHGAADAPEDLPDGVKDRSLCLLASMDGRFVRTSVEQRSQGCLGERLVLVGALQLVCVASEVRLAP